MLSTEYGEHNLLMMGKKPQIFLSDELIHVQPPQMTMRELLSPLYRLSYMLDCDTDVPLSVSYLLNLAASSVGKALKSTVTLVLAAEISAMRESMCFWTSARSDSSVRVDKSTRIAFS